MASNEVDFKLVCCAWPSVCALNLLCFGIASVGAPKPSLPGDKKTQDVNKEHCLPSPTVTARLCQPLGPTTCPLPPQPVPRSYVCTRSISCRMRTCRNRPSRQTRSQAQIMDSVKVVQHKQNRKRRRPMGSRHSDPPTQETTKHGTTEAQNRRNQQSVYGVLGLLSSPIVPDPRAIPKETHKCCFAGRDPRGHEV